MAPDSFGGWLGAPAVAARIGARLRAAGLEPVLLPQADGGEGTAEVLSNLATSAVALPASDSLGRDCGALCPVLPGPELFIESAHVLGPPDPETRRAWSRASSAGLARLLLDAATAARDHRADLVIGLGGSATVDGGLGLALGLGLRAEDVHGRVLTDPGPTGLARVHRIHGAPPTLPLRVWTDVRTPLSMCIQAYGSQKGVPPEAAPALTRDLMRFGEVLQRWSGRPLLPELPGGGAAGGVGLALAALTGATLEDGAQAVADRTRLRRHMAGCAAVVTGEGRLDATSREGKVVGTVTRIARRAGRPIIAVVGTDTRPTALPTDPDAVFPAGNRTPAALDAAADAAARWLRRR